MNILLDTVLKNNIHWANEGQVANYIPELSKANKNHAGIAIATLEGNLYTSGDSEVKFTIQSISKVLTLMLAIIDNGKEYFFSKVGMDPTSDDFNSIANLENKNEKKPLNPMINSGAIAVASMIKGNSKEEIVERILDFVKKLSGNPNISINKEVYLSEKGTGNKNKSLAYFLKDSGIITQDVDDVLDIYFRQCSIELTTVDIAKIALLIANDGVDITLGKILLPIEVTKLVKAIMFTCGMYNGSGEFAVNVGVPAKSGVGGGILVSVPKRMGIGTFGPALDRKGNSIFGIKALEELSRELQLSLF